MNRIASAHEAMATTFEIVVRHEMEDYTRQAVSAAFRELDRLEGELSRFMETSDISRMNRMAVHDVITIGDDTLRCLLDAFRISAATARAFDPAYLSRRGPDDSTDSVLAIDASNHSVTSLVQRLTVDLGAVGKGYALDCMARVLREWDVRAACLQGGGSSVLAYSSDVTAASGWPVRVGDHTLQLVNQSASASGTSVRGRHIVDPRHGRVAERARRIWAFARTAADSDALSTAFFVMSDEEIAEFCASHPEAGAAVLRKDGSTVYYGHVPQSNGADDFSS